MSTQQFSMLPHFGKCVADAHAIESEVAAHFDGATYDPAKDQVRLSEQLKEVRYFLLLGGWHTLAEIQAHVEKQLGRKVSEAGISARIRDLRKPRFGSYVVERKREDNTFMYRIRE